MNGYDTVFANANSEAEDFEVMFDQDDSLVDTINGCNEAGDPLTEADCPVKTQEIRSSSDIELDYEGIDADDSKDAPKDAEGTIDYKFEDEPEVGKKDDSTFVDPDDVSIDEDVDIDEDPDYEDLDADDSTDLTDDIEGLDGYDVEKEPEVGKKDDSTFVNVDDVSVDEDFDFDSEAEKVDFDFDVEGDNSDDNIGATEIEIDCGLAGCGSCKEDVDFDLGNQSDKDGVDVDIEKADDPENYDTDDLVDYVEDNDENNSNLDYDYSDEEIIDDVMNN